MKKLLIFSSILLFLPICTIGQSTPDMELVWSDEFNYNGLPDLDKWGYEEGFVRHEESQYYTKRRADNARVEDGNLIITAVKEDPLEMISGGGSFVTQNSGGEYTSASLKTENIFEFQTGRVEVRAKVPAGRGVWPAIWTLGVDRGYGPKDSIRTYSEIDIMEYVGWNEDKISGCAHWTPRWDGYRDLDGRCGKITVEKPYEDFHIYAVNWYEDRIEYYFNDENYLTLKKDAVPEGYWGYDVPHYLLLNLAIGGGWGNEMGIDDSIFPAEYQIDYVRIYEWK